MRKSLKGKGENGGNVPDDEKKWRSGSPAFFSIFLSYTYTHLCSSRHLL